MEITKKQFINFRRVFDIPTYQKEKYPNISALNEFSNGQWRGCSIQEFQERIDALSAWLIGQAYHPGDKIILMPVIGTIDWMVIDFACQQVGLIVVPVHPTSRADEIEIILRETEPKLFLTSDATLYKQFLTMVSPVRVAHLEDGADGYFEPLHTTPVTREAMMSISTIRDGISENEVFTILYTSGSTGVPKGVMLTHHNVTHNIRAILTILPLEPSHKVLSFLPFSHIFERATCYAYLAFGVSIYFSQSKESFTHDFNTVRPYFCTSVPRVLEKMFDFMQAQRLRQNWVRRKLISWAIQVGKKYEPGRMSPFQAALLQIAKLLVLNQWRQRLGGRIRYMTVGAASLRPEIGKLFTAAGIHVVEGYGMTETAPLITINRFEPGLNQFGTVGMPIPGVEVMIDQPNPEGEGEILVRGPNVTPGYFRKPDLTKDVFTEDGWLRTGDVGKFVHQRFLKITDRKKDIFKTSAGKYIAPLPLQNHFATSPFIQRCLILGFQRSFVSCLIVPDFEILEIWCKEHDVHWTSPQFMVHNIKVRSKIKDEIDRLNEDLPNFQRVRNFVICGEDWSIEKGEITTTMKPVRARLIERYQTDIDKLYA